MFPISIHAARVGCDAYDRGAEINRNVISIHAARVGCDSIFYHVFLVDFMISIHAARVGCDQVLLPFAAPFPAFQSTQPEWAATGSNATRYRR